MKEMGGGGECRKEHRNGPLQLRKRERLPTAGARLATHFVAAVIDITATILGLFFWKLGVLRLKQESAA